MRVIVRTRVVRLDPNGYVDGTMLHSMCFTNNRNVQVVVLC